MMNNGLNNVIKNNKCSAAADMGDRFATIDMDRKGGLLCPFRENWIPSKKFFRLGRGLPDAKWHLYPSSRLATIEMGRRFGGAAFVEGS